MRKDKNKIINGQNGERGKGGGVEGEQREL
jgi:hypothetical protein